MTTLRQKIENLEPERKAKVSQRADELIAEEVSLRASSATDASPDAPDSQPEQGDESAVRKLA